jgi:hypothetical protein
VAFDTLTAAELTSDIALGEHTVRKLRGHLMPPPGSKQPTQAESNDLINWLETSLDARKDTPRAQYVTAQRLNRTEYANAVRTLLAVDIKVEDLLPPDVELEGFDNIAASLTVSPAFLDQYINAARSIAARATGQGAPKLVKATYLSSQGGGGAVMPPGAGNGFKFKHFFPADGEYRVSIVSGGVAGRRSACAHPLHVAARAEGRTRAGDHDAARLGTLAQRGEEAAQGGAQRVRQRVARLGAIQRQPRDAVFERREQLVGTGLQLHRVSPTRGRAARGER